MTPNELAENARKNLGEFTLSKHDFTAGSAAAALLTKKGNIYTGICIDVGCGIGFCAEHAAIAEMLKKRETEIEMIVAVSEKGIIPPCGRCRELIFQVNKSNAECSVVLNNDRIAKLKDLLPEHWML